jgi:hypothetical protein
VDSTDSPCSLDDKQLAFALRSQIAADQDRVVWEHEGDEVLVHLASLRTLSRPGALFASIELETDQTGRHPLIMTLALSCAEDDPSLIAVTDEAPRGHATLVGRWGHIVQEALWGALLSLVTAEAEKRAEAPRGLVVGADGVVLVTGDPLCFDSDVAQQPNKART